MSKRLVKVHTEYDPPVDPGVDCSVLPSMTQQNFQAECDVNNIIARFQDVGFADFPSNDASRFMDVASAVDYHTAQNLIAQANEVFLDLPAKVRKRFDNDPVSFLRFLDDPANYDEARDLGLLKPVAAPAAAAGPQGSPSAAAAPAAVSGAPVSPS